MIIVSQMFQRIVLGFSKLKDEDLKFYALEKMRDQIFLGCTLIKDSEMKLNIL